MVAVDLRALYMFDVWAAVDGQSSRQVDLALGLAGRLQWEPMSEYRVAVAGDESFMGWDRNSTALAALYDVSATQAKGKKLKDKERYPLPKVKPKKKKTAKDKLPTTVKDLNWASMLGDFHG